MARIKLENEYLWHYNRGYAYRGDDFAVGVWEASNGQVYLATGEGLSAIIECEFDIGLRVLSVFMGAYVE